MEKNNKNIVTCRVSWPGRTITAAVIKLLLVVFMFSACDDFLTEDLKGTFSSDTFYQNDKQAIQAVNGCYNAIAFGNFNNAIWVFGDVASNDAVKGGNPGDQAEITYIEEFNVDANNGIINNYWSFAYEAIARANNVIAYVPDVPMEDELKNRLIGEAKFIRAYTYFNLANIFGKVPLKLLPQLTKEAIHVPLSDISAIYQQMEKDLLDAAMVLPVTYSASETGRMTRGAALAMLGKINMYQQNWPLAIEHFHEVEALGIYDLLPDYAAVFMLENENSYESIIEIQHLSGQVPFAGNALNQWFAPAPEGGYYFNAPTQSLVDAFEKSSSAMVDPRLDASIGRAGSLWLNGEPFNAGWSPTGYLTKKHQQPLSQVSSSLKGDGDLNYIYLRYADVLLFKAEAFNEMNMPDSALTNLNRVRQRARNSYEGILPDGLLEDIGTTSQSLLRTAIQHERRVELAQEFHRYFDLMRWGRTVAESTLGSEFDYETKRYLPVPQAEIDANQAITP